MPGDRAQCLYCGGNPEVIADTRIFDCPGCERTMAKVDDGGIVVDQCPECGGRFYDTSELEQALRAARVEGREAAVEETTAALRKQAGVKAVTDAVRVRRCPVCREAMGRRNFGRVSGVIIDTCVHGVYLDAGEFEQIQEYVRRGGERLSQRHEAAEDARDRRARQVFRRGDEGYRIALELSDDLTDSSW